MSTKLERLITIDAWIRAGRCPNARSVMECFEVSERTAYDDHLSHVGQLPEIIQELERSPRS